MNVKRKVDTRRSRYPEAQIVKYHGEGLISGTTSDPDRYKQYQESIQMNVIVKHVPGTHYRWVKSIQRDNKIIDIFEVIKHE